MDKTGTADTAAQGNPPGPKVPSAQLIVNYDAAAPSCSYTLLGTFPMAALVNMLEVIKLDLLNRQWAAIAQARAQQLQNGLVLPDGSPVQSLPGGGLST